MPGLSSGETPELATAKRRIGELEPSCARCVAGSS
jgi:hypothetical protein